MAEGGVELLERMRHSRSSWGEDDFHHLYRSFGFQEITRSHAPHRMYLHPEFPDLRATVGRHRSLAKGYATTAVCLIDTLRISARRSGNAMQSEERPYNERYCLL